MTPVVETEAAVRLAELIRGAERAVVLTGAGVSVPSGIPDFRTPGKGLWEKVNPMEVAHIDVFRREPDRFWHFYGDRFASLKDIEPNRAHEVVAELEKRGHEVVAFGPVAGQEESDWPLVCGRVAEAVAAGEADQGIVCCWTGTGASIAANKVRGIRAALVHDAETARGARIWNHANVLALSLRATPIPVMREILDAWYGTSASEGEAQSTWNRQQIDRIRQLEEKYQRG